MLYQKKEQEKDLNDLRAITIGIILIIIIASFTIFKASSTKNETPKKEQPATKEKEVIDTNKLTRLSAKELLQKMSLSGDLILVDLRDESSYDTEHIIGSINTSPAKLETLLAKSDTNSSYILIDQSEEAPLLNAIAKIFNDSGYKNIYYLEGGFTFWKNSFYPFITDGNPNSFSNQSKVTYISSDELKKQLDEKNKFVFIDIRKATEFNTGHIAGAVNIPLDELERKRKEIPFGRNIVVYGDVIEESVMGAVKLFDLGIVNTLTLSDGLIVWKQKGYEVVR